MNLQEEIPWPFGRRWRWTETITWSMLCFMLALSGGVILLLGQPWYLAEPVALAELAASYGCYRAVKAHRTASGGPQ